MKKKLIFISISIILVTIVCVFNIQNKRIIFSDVNNTSIPEVTSNPSKDEWNHNKINLPKQIQEVIDGTKKFIDAQDGKVYTLNSYRIKNRADKDTEVYWGQYIIANIDSDKDNEIIFEAFDANNLKSDIPDHKVFDCQGNVVYCYTYCYRAIIRVYSDGAMYGSSGAADGRFKKAYFKKRKSEDRVIAESKSIQNKVNYFIHNKKVSEKKYYHYIKKYALESEVKPSKYSLS